METRALKRNDFLYFDKIGGFLRIENWSIFHKIFDTLNSDQDLNN